MYQKVPEPLAVSLCILGEMSYSAIDNLSLHRNLSIIHSEPSFSSISVLFFFLKHQKAFYKSP